MARYIDADKLWNDRPLIPEGKSQDYGEGFCECMFGFSERIRKQIDNPTADVVEVKRGKFIKRTSCSEPECDQCGKCPKLIFGVLPNYCPHCGAKMDAETTLMNNQDL